MFASVDGCLAHIPFEIGQMVNPEDVYCQDGLANCFCYFRLRKCWQVISCFQKLAIVNSEIDIL